MPKEYEEQERLRTLGCVPKDGWVRPQSTEERVPERQSPRLRLKLVASRSAKRSTYMCQVIDTVGRELSPGHALQWREEASSTCPDFVVPEEDRESEREKAKRRKEKDEESENTENGGHDEQGESEKEEKRGRGKGPGKGWRKGLGKGPGKGRGKGRGKGWRKGLGKGYETTEKDDGKNQ